MDRLTSLTVFVQVADRGGFSAAARRLNMSTTMVSAHIRALEERLGARLLNRTTRKVNLTDVGRAYYDRCTQILQELDDADHVAGDMQSTPRGTLRLYTNGSLAELITPLIAEFLSQYGGVAVDLNVGERMVDLVEEGYDLAIRSVPLPESSLIVRRLTPWRHILCCAPSYLATHDAPRRPEDLPHHNCLQYSFFPFGHEWHFLDANGQPAVAQITGNFTSHSAVGLRLVALAGLGLFLAPSFVVADDIKAGRLVRLMPDYQSRELAINAVYPHKHYMPAKVRQFLDLLTVRFAEHRQWINPGKTG